MSVDLPVAWAMPDLPPGWSIEKADIGHGYYLGGRRMDDGSIEPELVIRLRHDKAHVRVALRKVEEFVGVLALLEAMTPCLPSRPGVYVSLEMNYY